MERDAVDAAPTTMHDTQCTGSDHRGRCSERLPLYCALRLTPIDQSGSLLHDDTIDIFGKNMSVVGMAFSHDKPLLHRQVVISHNDPKIGQLAVAARILWSKPTPLGTYESGCWFIRTLARRNLSCEQQ